MARETVTIVGSQRLIEMLCKINHTIAYDLLEQLKYRGSSTISYLDFGESSDSISFIYSNKMYELQREFDYKWTEKVWKEKRAEMKIGKVIKQIFGDRYPVNNPKGQQMPKPPIDIESFVNLYKAEREKNENSERFHIVSGEDIVYWYNFKNYTRFVREDTPLGKSCLRYEESGKFLEMYVKNPEKVSMLILKDDQDKLRGRALVWNLDVPENRVYMDRIYTVNDFDIELFKDFARKNGWLYKERQTFGWNNIIVDSRNNNLYTPSNLKLEVVLNDKKLRYYPYLDTLSVYNKKKGILNNQGQLLRMEGHLHLIDYQGSYVDEVYHREYVYSNYYAEEIVREDAVYCQIDDDWVYNHDSVYVHNTDGLYAIKTSNKIVFSKFLNKSKFFLKEDAVYSEFMKTWIYKDSVREAYINEQKTEKGIIHFRLIGKTFHKDENGDIVIGKPKRNENESKKKEVKKKKSLDFETFYNYINGNESPRLIPEQIITELIEQNQHHDIDDEYYDDRHNQHSSEEEGDGSDRPIPRSRIRRPHPTSNRVFGNITAARSIRTRFISDQESVLDPDQSLPTQPNIENGVQSNVFMDVSGSVGNVNGNGNGNGNVDYWTPIIPIEQANNRIERYVISTDNATTGNDTSSNIIYGTYGVQFINNDNFSMINPPNDEEQGIDISSDEPNNTI